MSTRQTADEGSTSSEKKVSPAAVARLLDRFVLAQNGVFRLQPYSAALAEIEAGRKTSHWIWYILPQFKDPNRQSANNDYFQIYSADEAVAYLQHPVLGSRLLTMLRAVDGHLRRKSRINVVMGSSVDATKLFHCVSTFLLAAASLAATTADSASSSSWGGVASPEARSKEQRQAGVMFLAQLLITVRKAGDFGPLQAPIPLVDDFCRRTGLTLMPTSLAPPLAKGESTTTSSFSTAAWVPALAAVDSDMIKAWLATSSPAAAPSLTADGGSALPSASVVDAA